jgi:hypothetical protein
VRQLPLVRCFAQCQYRSNIRQYQALFCLLTKRKPALVSRAVQLVLPESIGAIGVKTGGARRALPASGPKERPVAGSETAPIGDVSAAARRAEGSMLVDALYLREKAHYCVALARGCPHLWTAQALEVLGTEMMEKAAELERDRTLSPPRADQAKT